MMEINIKKDRPSKLHWWHGYKALGDNDPKDITTDNNEKKPFNLSVQFATFQCPKVRRIDEILPHQPSPYDICKGICTNIKISLILKSTSVKSFK